MQAMCGSELTPKIQGLRPADLRLQAQVRRVIASAEAPPSPCISVCRMSDDTTYCVGCWRTLDEIGGWGQRNADDKRVGWGLIGERLAAQASAQ